MSRPRPRRFAAWVTVAAGLMALRWAPGEAPEPEPGPAALWRPRAPAPAVTATSSLNAGFKRHAPVLALTPVSVSNDLTLKAGVRLSFPLPNGRVAGGVVRLVKARNDGGQVAGGRLADGGTFILGRVGNAWTGVVLPKAGEEAFRLLRADDGDLALATVPRESVLCASLPRAPRTRRDASSEASASGARAATRATPAPLLNSRPDAEPVIFLDFDGATVAEPAWNGGETIVAADSGMTQEAITAAWRRVAEDYRPFRVNVTTDPARYAAARPMQRMRCIVTTSNEWFNTVGGVAFLFSWREAGVEIFSEDVPAWAFSDQNDFDAADVALAISHEVGHTLGLSHDGAHDPLGGHHAEYYEGHGSGSSSWGPIMGAPYGRAIIQWNHGDYAGTAVDHDAATNTTTIFSGVASNHEDDVAIIGGIENHTGFAPERRGAALADAGRLAVSVDGTAVDHRGLLEAGGAESWLLMAAGPGPASLALVPDTAEDPGATNVDASLTVTTIGGDIVGATADIVGSRFPSLQATLPAEGVYVLRVKSVGEGDPAAGGYSAYGGIGRFRVQGTLPPATGVAPRIGGAARVEGRLGEIMSYQIEAAGDALTYAAEALPPGLAVAADGRIVGAPTASGVFTATVRATNSAGAADRAVVFAVADSDLPRALDAPALTLATGGDRPWRTVAEADAPRGGSAARSGEVLDNYHQTWIETTLAGPGRLRWRWRVSSEADYDFFNAELDGAAVDSISGETAWALRTLEVPAGTHTVRWSYDKDPYLAVGADAAWLDDLRWDRGFELWAETAGLAGAPADGPEADADGDGLVNLLEYAFGRSPALADGLGESVGVAPSAEPGAGGALEITFTRPAGREDLRHVVEVSGDLLVWRRGHAYGPGVENAPGLPTVEIAREPVPGGGERIRVRDATGGARRFIRVRVERD